VKWAEELLVIGFEFVGQGANVPVACNPWLVVRGSLLFGRTAGTGGDQCFLQWKGERMSMRAAFVICATALGAFALPGFFQEKGLGE